MAGCGTVTSSSTRRITTAPVAATAPIEVPAGARANVPSVTTKDVVGQVNVVCVALLHGWPAPLRAPYTVARLTRYAHTAAAPAARLEASLWRLERLGDTKALSALQSGWRQFQALLGVAEAVGERPASARSLGRQLVIHQQMLSALATQNRVPACAVAAA